MADEARKEFTKLSPTDLCSFTDKNVILTLCDGRIIQGYVYTIDPVSFCVVLVEEIMDAISNQKMTFVMGHAVKDIKIDENQQVQDSLHFIEQFLSGSAKDYSKEALLERRSNVESWLSKNRIPYKAKENDESLCVMDVLTIEPPYEPDSCRCSNQIVLNRVRNLIENMPV